MRVMSVHVPTCPGVIAFVLVRRGLYVINLSARPDAKIIRLDFLP
jgi:hypothetical protein